MAVTVDVMGGQTVYNSLGNIAFFGLGMYVSAVVQIAVVYDVAEYTAAFGAIRVDFTASQYFGGLALGLAVAGVAAAVVSVLVGLCVLGLRGPDFAIGTPGVAVLGRASCMER